MHREVVDHAQLGEERREARVALRRQLLRTLGVCACVCVCLAGASWSCARAKELCHALQWRVLMLLWCAPADKG